MTAWAWVLIGVLMAGIVLVRMALTKATSKNNRMEEADRAPLQSDSKDPQTENDANALIDNRNAERCVCCGEIIPEGQQVCFRCSEKANQQNVWW